MSHIYLNIIVTLFQLLDQISTMGGKKEKFLSIRVGNSLLNELESYAEKYGEKKSNIIRSALRYYFRFAQKDNSTENPYIILTKSEFKYVIQHLGEEELQEFARRSFNSAEKIRNNIIKQLTNKDYEEVKPYLKPRLFMDSLEHFLFGYHGQNWFKDITQYFNKDKYYFSGKHVLNLNFSKYILYFLDEIMNEIGFSVIEKQIKENFVFFMYQKKTSQ